MKPYTIGVISDTHGLVRDEVKKIFRGVKFIIHAGDIGGDDILNQLKEIAPTVAVRGNTDVGKFGHTLKERLILNLEHFEILVVHDIHTIDESKFDKKIKLVIYGHSHKPIITIRNGVTYLNPGSAGPRRFNLPVSLALLNINKEHFAAEFFEIPKSEGKNDSHH